MKSLINSQTSTVPNFNCCTVEVWEWIRNFIQHFMIDNHLSMLRLHLIHVGNLDPEITNCINTLHVEHFVGNINICLCIGLAASFGSNSFKICSFPAGTVDLTTARWDELHGLTEAKGPFYWWFFHRSSNFIQIMFSWNFMSSYHIAGNFCTCHDSCAVVACAKFCSDQCMRVWMWR